MCAISGTVVFEESPPQRKFSKGHFLIRKMILEYTETIPDDEVEQAGFVGIEHLYRRNRLKVLHFRKKNKVGRKGRKPESKAPLMLKSFHLCTTCQSVDKENKGLPNITTKNILPPRGLSAPLFSYTVHTVHGLDKFL